MVLVGVDDSSIQTDLQSKSVGLVWGLAAACCCSMFIKWTESQISQWVFHDDTEMYARHCGPRPRLLILSLRSCKSLKYKKVEVLNVWQFKAVSYCFTLLFTGCDQEIRKSKKKCDASAVEWELHCVRQRHALQMVCGWYHFSVVQL